MFNGAKSNGKSFAGLHHFIQLVSAKQKGQNDKNNGEKCLYWF
jgi:hypothetical protein